ncbi:hypothetical protein ABZU75_15615 [Streptosporangium sp. NPDC005286]
MAPDEAAQPEVATARLTSAAAIGLHRPVRRAGGTGIARPLGRWL